MLVCLLAVLNVLLRLPLHDLALVYFTPSIKCVSMIKALLLLDNQSIAAAVRAKCDNRIIIGENIKTR